MRYLFSTDRSVIFFLHKTRFLKEAYPARYDLPLLKKFEGTTVIKKIPRAIDVREHP